MERWSTLYGTKTILDIPSGIVVDGLVDFAGGGLRKPEGAI